MRVLEVRNVCEAYRRGMELIEREGMLSDSRAGGVYVLPTPVCTVYSHPTERVLLEPSRDANPFFHLMEAMWMLSGSRDARWLDRFVSDFSSRFAEEDGLQHGAYGYRWRQHFCDASDDPLDQLLIVSDMLRDNPTTRRAVLQMWDAQADLGVDYKRDLPCNTQVYFQTRPLTSEGDFVNMTVCCRSNDIIWGAYGANAVHMSIMGEVVAGLAGMKLGTYYQISNNYHAYQDVFRKFRDGLVRKDEDGYIEKYPDPWYDPYANPLGKMLSVVSGETSSDLENSAQDILSDCEKLVQYDVESRFTSPFFRGVVRPMWRAHIIWRDTRDAHLALSQCSLIDSWDWRQACSEWIQRRDAGRK